MQYSGANPNHRQISGTRRKQKRRRSSALIIFTIGSLGPSSRGGRISWLQIHRPNGARSGEIVQSRKRFINRENYPRAAPIFSNFALPSSHPNSAPKRLSTRFLLSANERKVAGIVRRLDSSFQAFPDNPLLRLRLTAVAPNIQESDKNYDAALSGLERDPGEISQARETRGSALQLKRSFLVSPQNPKGMSDTFRQLLKEFRKARPRRWRPLLHRQSRV